jgi:cysteine sulfinate desulfinase/cysteine desulfurase-like protein
MGMSDKDAFSAVRLSLGVFSTEVEIKKALKAVINAL